MTGIPFTNKNTTARSDTSSYPCAPPPYIWKMIPQGPHDRSNIGPESKGLVSLFDSVEILQETTDILLIKQKSG